MPEQPATNPIPVEHTNDFRTQYANNIRYESTVYDLTMTFGQSDQGGATEVIRQHTSITIPWAMVRLAIYYLRVHLLIHESTNGKVHVPVSQTPDRFPDPAVDFAADNPILQETLRKLTGMREDFIADL